MFSGWFESVVPRAFAPADLEILVTRPTHEPDQGVLLRLTFIQIAPNPLQANRI